MICILISSSFGRNNSRHDQHFINSCKFYYYNADDVSQPKYPEKLLHVLYSEMLSLHSTTSTTPSTTSSSTQATNPSGGCSCPASGYTLVGNGDCTGYYYCNNGVKGAFQACATGLLFDASLQGCNWANHLVTCACANSQTTSTSSTSSSTHQATTTSTPQTTSTVTTSEASTTQAGGCSLTCPPAPTGWSIIGSEDCLGYYHCSNGVRGAFQPCAAGLLFDANILGCNWDYNVICGCGENLIRRRLRSSMPVM